MKSKFSFISMAALLGMALCLVQCTDDHLSTEIPQTEKTEIPEIPAEIAQYLSETEIQNFYAGPPAEMLKLDEASKKYGKQKRWHPFFAWGKAVGTFYPILENCNDPLSAVLCFQEGACPDQSQWKGLAARAKNRAFMSGYGLVTKTWENYICGFNPENGWPNGSYRKGKHKLQYHPGGAPSISFLDETTVQLDMEMVVCDASAPLDPLCWDYNSGNFAEAEGTFHWRWIGPVEGLAPGPFNPIPAWIISWGWLYY